MAQNAKYGGGFLFRMAVLLILLALVASAFFYDRMVLQPQAVEKIENVLALAALETDDGGGIPKDKVHETIGLKASETKSHGNYEIETYKFQRVLPFVSGQYVNVVYQNGTLVLVLPNKDFDPNILQKDRVKPGPPADQRNLPVPAAAGGAPPTSDDDEAEEGDEGKADDDAKKETGDDESSEKKDDAKQDDSTQTDDEEKSAESESEGGTGEQQEADDDQADKDQPKEEPQADDDGGSDEGGPGKDGS